MKKIYLILFTFSLTTGLHAQEMVTAKISEASSSYTSGNLQDARYLLQQSLTELDVLICKEVMAILPSEIQGLQYNATEDYITGNAMGIIGSSVTRKYGEPEQKQIGFVFMNNSPMLTSITMFLTNPLLVNTADGSQKSIKVEGIKSIIQNNDLEKNNMYTIQIPLNQSLITLEFDQFSEAEAIKAAESFNISEIQEILN